MASSPASYRSEPKRVETVSEFSRKHLGEIFRGTGESYAEHGIEVAAVLGEINSDPSLISIAMLHDLLVHRDGTALLDASPLTGEERAIVEQMYKLRRRHIDESTDDLELVIDAFVEDPRVMLLRMAHRMNDVRHLDRFSRARRRELAHETLHMYTAISGRLGFHRWRWQMEDICFKELQPRTFRTIERQFASFRDIDQTCLEHTKQFLLEKLTEHGLDITIDSRIKGVYSTYRKMVLKDRPFAELTDRIALRVLLSNIDDCYRALGVIHANMHSIPGRLKDYIGMPKENGYRSIHTIVYPLAGVTELPMEIQIRTHDMHRDSDVGLAAHSNYKNIHYALNTKTARVNLFRNREHLQSLAHSPAEFALALRTSFSEDDLLLFDDENHIYHMRPPATALDFACIAMKIDPLTITSVRINGRAQPLGVLLRDGDTVRVLTGTATTTREQFLRSCQQTQTRKLIRDAWGMKGKKAIAQ